MKKYLAIFGILLLSAVSFASLPPGPIIPRPPGPMTSGPEWNAYVQTCCQAVMLAGHPGYPVYNWANDISDNYAVWNGEGCAAPQMLYHDWEIWNMMWMERGSVSDYYGQMSMACGFDPTSAECKNAKTAFYASARSARAAFAATKTNYMLAARQDIFAYVRGYCTYVSPSDVAQDIYDSAAAYRQCMQNPIDYCMLVA